MADMLSFMCLHHEQVIVLRSLQSVVSGVLGVFMSGFMKDVPSDRPPLMLRSNGDLRSVHVMEEKKSPGLLLVEVLFYLRCYCAWKVNDDAFSIPCHFQDSQD